jgi:hypothetical protein
MVIIEEKKKIMYSKSRSINIDLEYIDKRTITEQYGTSISWALRG